MLLSARLYLLNLCTDSAIAYKNVVRSWCCCMEQAFRILYDKSRCLSNMTVIELRALPPPQQ